MKKFSKAKVNYRKSERKVMNKVTRRAGQKLENGDYGPFVDSSHLEEDEWSEMADPYDPGADYGW